MLCPVDNFLYLQKLLLILQSISLLKVFEKIGYGEGKTFFKKFSFPVKIFPHNFFHARSRLRSRGFLHLYFAANNVDVTAAHAVDDFVDKTDHKYVVVHFADRAATVLDTVAPAIDTYGHVFAQHYRHLSLGVFHRDTLFHTNKYCPIDGDLCTKNGKKSLSASSRLY